MMIGIGLIAAAVVGLVVLAMVMVGVVFMVRRASGGESLAPFNPNEAAPVSLSSSGFSPAVPSGAGFRMTVTDVFNIKGRGLVVTGRVEEGSLAKGQRVSIATPDGAASYEVQVKSIEAFNKVIEVAEPGQTIGLLLSDEEKLTKDHIRSGMVVTSI
jgi:hypothetical protein